MSASDNTGIETGSTEATAVANYFPASCEHMFGPLPIPDRDFHKDTGVDASLGMFPHNVSFRAADWVRDELTEDAEGYDVVIA